MITRVFLDMSMIGVASGFISGFMGAGTGIIVVPFLLWYFSQMLGFDSATSLLVTTSTSIAIMTITSFFNYYFRRHPIVYNRLMYNMLFLIPISSVIGLLLKPYIAVWVYKIILAIMLVYFGIKMIQQAHSSIASDTHPKLSGAVLYIKCFFVYILSVIAGTGTGMMLIPVFRSYGLQREDAIATIKLLAIYNCALISLFDVIINRDLVKLDYCIGTIYILGFVLISIFNLPSIYLGILVSEKLKSAVFDYVFACFLFTCAGLLYWL